MATNVIFIGSFLAIFAYFSTRATCVPVIVDSSELWQPYERSEEFEATRPQAYPIDVEELRDLLSPVVMQRRSVEPKGKNDVFSNLGGLENVDDLETAAGTNILRPLFVYRQQLAYRERIRKAGRRSVPNF